MFATAFNAVRSTVFGTPTTPLNSLFPKVDPAVDGDDCDLDCNSCTIKYPRGFKVNEEHDLYGFVKEWAVHVLVATGKSDWTRNVEGERGSVMEAFGRVLGLGGKFGAGKLMLSASNIPTPSHTSDYSEPTTILLLPAFTIVSNVTPASVPALMADIIESAPTNRTPMTSTTTTHINNNIRHAHSSTIPKSLSSSSPAHADGHHATTTITTTVDDDAQRLLAARACPHSALILLCSQATRDARCGQSAPLLRRELERHLRPRGLFRDLDDERPGGVGIYFISHTGGHKYSANVIVYRKRDAFGLDGESRRAHGDGDGDGGSVRELVPKKKKKKTTSAPQKRPTGAAADGGHHDGAVMAVNGQGSAGGEADAAPAENGAERQEGEQQEEEEEKEEEQEQEDQSAAQCIWLARVRPEDCEGVVRFTVLQGKVVKPERQLRGGFDRERQVFSW